MTSSKTRSVAKNSNVSKLPLVTQRRLGRIVQIKDLGKHLRQVAKGELARVLEEVRAGVPVEPGKYRVIIRTRKRRKPIGMIGGSEAPPPMTSSETPSVVEDSNLPKLSLVTQRRLGRIVQIQELGKYLLQVAEEELASVLEEVQAGVPVEPGKYKVKIRTRKRRKPVGTIGNWEPPLRGA